jgi:hypothetical protein
MRAIFETELALNIADAFALASEFALGFSIRSMDRESLRIVLNLTSMPSAVLFFTWVKAYVIRVHFVDEELSRVRVLAMPVRSPHNLFRFPFFLAHRIDPVDFGQQLRRHFSLHQATHRE